MAGDHNRASEVRDATSFGVLALTLAPQGYAWEYLPEAVDEFTDAGNVPCHP